MGLPPSLVAGIALLVGAGIGFGLRAWLARAERARALAEAEAARAVVVAQSEERGRALAQAEAVAKEREARLEALARELGQVKETLAAERAGAEASRTALEEKIALLERAREGLTDTFKALSADVLKETSSSFLTLAKASFERYHEGAKGELDQRQAAFAELVGPVRESLGKLDTQLAALDLSRAGGEAALKAQLAALLESERELRDQAAGLVQALKAPAVRGRWGELQLKRVVELSGMLNRCDFFEQQTARGEDGLLRPDLLVRLVGGKSVVVDAKAPLEAFLAAAEAKEPEARTALLADHARQLRAHVTTLSRKAYWEQFQPSPELVVLFVPGEAILGAALEADPSLLEFAFAQSVVVASPTSLIALLRAAAHGWKEESAARSAKEIREIGAELYKRLSDLGGHFAKLGRALGSSVEAYNKALGSLESRALVSARKLKALELAPSEAELPSPEPLDALPRDIVQPELLEAEFG